MKRRQFMHNSLAASAGLALPTPEATLGPPRKAFKVKALQSRYNPRILYGQTPLDFKLLSTDTENKLSIFISSNNQKGLGPPLHVHHSLDEFFCVLAGDFLFELDGETTALAPGDTLFIPRNVKHRFHCVSQTSGTLLVSLLPGNRMEPFFAEMGKLLPQAGPPDLAAMQALYKRYDSEILGPPLGV